MRVRTSILVLGLLLRMVWPLRAAAESPNCIQARAILSQVVTLYDSSPIDHVSILSKLDTARHLCPTLGEAFKWSYCSASALGRQQKARTYKDRAIFNEVSDFSCVKAKVVPELPPLPSFVREKYALIVGVGQFRDPQVPALRFAAKDARDLAAVLTDPRYGRFDKAKVRVLTDQQATRANILDSLQNLILEAGEDDLVLIYVSSHGSPQRDGAGLGGVGYIVTHDTALKNIWVDALDYQSFSARAAMIKARRKVVLLDTCYSGQASRTGEKALAIESAGVGAATAKLFLSGEGTYVITSSKDDEKSFESETLSNSYFTHHLIAALKRSEEPPTLKQIFQWMERDVPEAVARDFAMPQHPQMLPAESPGDLRIGVATKPRE